MTTTRESYEQAREAAIDRVTAADDEYRRLKTDAYERAKQEIAAALIRRDIAAAEAVDTYGVKITGRAGITQNPGRGLHTTTAETGRQAVENGRKYLAPDAAPGAAPAAPTYTYDAETETLTIDGTPHATETNLAGKRIFTTPHPDPATERAALAWLAETTKEAA